MRTLVAGIGNVFLGDDGFGVEVARRLAREPLDGVEVADFGIRGIHLAYELADGRYDHAILVDACPRGGEPGTLYTIAPDLEAAGSGPQAADPHSLTPDAVLTLVRQIGWPPARIVIVGCEPETLEPKMGLSPPVEAAVDRAVALVRELVAEANRELRCV
jgi:hydrogenase maturation protease